jgi:hypothetical protein
VRGLWTGVCGYYIPPSKLAPGEMENRTCVMPSAGFPMAGLTDDRPPKDLSKPFKPRILAIWEDGTPIGGPLQLEEGVPAYYRVTLNMEDPCTPSDGGLYGGANPPAPPGKSSPPCPVGSLVEARR